MRTTRNTDQAIAGPTRFTGPRNIGTGANPGLVPTLGLNFLVDYLTPAVSFSRASNATMFDSQGRLVWAPHNLCTRGLDLSTGWSISGSGYATGDLVGPLGGVGYTITWDVTNPSSGHALTNQSAVAGTSCAFSVYLKYINHRWARLAVYSANNAANQFRCWVDLQNATIGTANAGGTSSLLSATVESLSNGWMRVCIIGFNSWFNTSDASLLIASAVADGDTTRAGDGAAIGAANPLYELYGPQTPQIWTNGHATEGSVYYGERLDYNPKTLTSRGILVEEGRANLISVSDSPGVTGATSTASPSTILGRSAVRLTSTGGGVAGAAIASGSVQTASTRYFLSVYVKYVDCQYVQLATTINASDPTVYANFDIINGTITAVGAGSIAEIVDCGNGVYRLVMAYISNAAPTGGAPLVLYVISTSTATRGAGVAGVLSVDFMGMQQEQAVGYSSLIPTFGVAASRSADTPTVALAGWYNSLGGTVVCEFEAVGAQISNSRTLFNFLLVATGYPQRNQLRLNAGVSTVGPILTVDNVVQPGMTAVSVSQVPRRVAWQFAEGAQSLTATSQGVTTGTASIPTNVDQLRLGCVVGNAESLNGWIRAFVYYDKRDFTSSELQALTVL